MVSTTAGTTATSKAVVGGLSARGEGHKDQCATLEESGFPMPSYFSLPLKKCLLMLLVACHTLQHLTGVI